MSETYPPDGGQGRDAPPVETSTSQPPAVPPGGTTAATMTPPPPPEPRPKRKLDWPFAVLGFFTPTLILGGWLMLGSLPSVANALPLVVNLAGLIQLAVIVGAVAAIVVGVNRGSNRLRSFGIGALFAYAAYALVALLAVGACLVAL